ncbi:DUF433 domain-containing protein [Asticcacaulis sp. SL142]|uniref:DUF433 domain-containing protein n=1 Tax=Asticcacaulis sp. SL142 TaxID=2995155 RepID=UPI00226CE273|nr:DUF433 domain-containing protein [Asticcacaulis sp. SL142]WAC48083.1 DUF433 domain-containing protein [Asticcacaulis sp. SL142]
MTPVKVKGAYSVEQVSRLTHLSPARLAEWDRAGFFPPEFAEDNRRLPYSRIYSFSDVVGLKTLQILRDKWKVPMLHLREVADQLAAVCEKPWSELRLAVLKNEVLVLDDLGQGEAVLNGQKALIELDSVIDDLHRDIASMRKRPSGSEGKLERSKYVLHNAQRIAGTRIPVSAVIQYLKSGATDEEIIEAYPDLTSEDIATVRAVAANKAA